MCCVCVVVFVFSYQRNPSCSVCHPPAFVSIDPMSPFSALLDQLSSDLSLIRPSFSVNGQLLYLPNLHAQYADNLEKCVGELMDSGTMGICNDKQGKTIQVCVIHKQQ